MKSGTAQKLVLNMLTTTSMVKLGKVYENMMVDLQLTNNKLIDRAARIVMLATGADNETAVRALADAEGHVKTAIVMVTKKVTRDQAKELLVRAHGFVRGAIGKNK
jgi:N-acetylmuramic acid 6-phosphate etherase